MNIVVSFSGKSPLCNGIKGHGNTKFDRQASKHSMPLNWSERHDNPVEVTYL